MISPSSDFHKHKNEPQVRKVRRLILLEFLKSMTDDKCRVVVRRGVKAHNLLIIGDWFVADSKSPTQKSGWERTIGTRHAPTVLKKIADFDAEFEELLRQFAPRGASSRKKAIDVLGGAIKRIEGR